MKLGQIQITTIEASEGMTLTNGNTYSKLVYLGVHDSPDNWHEIPDDQVPSDNDNVDNIQE